MLLKKYRQVLRRCGILNFAGALAIAGMCAVPAYSAEPLPPLVIISGEQTISEPITPPVNNMIVGEDGALTVAIPSPDAANPQVLRIDGSLLLSGGSIKVDGGKGIYGGSPEEVDSDFELTGDFQMNGGRLDINASEMRFKDIQIRDGSTINISGSVNGDTSNWQSNARLGTNNDGSMLIEGANTTVNIGNYGMISTVRANINDAIINLSGDTPESAGLLRAWSDYQIRSEGASINVPTGKFGVIATSDLQALDSRLNVAGNLNLAGFLWSGNRGTLPEALERTQRGRYNFENSTINIGQGARLNLNNSEFYLREGSTLHNAGQIRTEGYLDLRNGGAFTAESGSNLTVGPGHSEGGSQIRLSADQLREALKGSIAVGTGYLTVEGTATLDADRIVTSTDPNAYHDGYVSFNGNDANIQADALTIKGGKIDTVSKEYGFIGTLGAKNMQLDQNVELNGNLAINNAGVSLDPVAGLQSGLKAGDGTGVINMSEDSRINIVSVGGNPQNIINIDAAITGAGAVEVMHGGASGTDSAPVNFNQSLEVKSLHIGRPMTAVFNKDVTVDANMYLGNRANVTLAAGADEKHKNTFTINGNDGTQAGLYIGHDAVLNVNQAKTALVTSKEAQSSFDNRGTINATSSSLGLIQNGDIWSSDNLGSRINGDGRINIDGLPEEISKTGFKDIHDMVGGGILKVNSTIIGAVTDGKVSLADVIPGAILAGADLGSAIVTGDGPNDIQITGAFGGITLSNPEATGITVSVGYPLQLNGNGAYLVSTPGGLGNVTVNYGGVATFANGSIGNIVVEDDGRVNLNNIGQSATVSTGDVTLEGSGQLVVNGTVEAATIQTTLKEGGEAGGTITTRDNSSLTVANSIGAADKPIGQIDGKGDIKTQNIYVENLVKTRGSVIADNLISANRINIEHSSLTAKDITSKYFYEMDSIITADTITSDTLQANGGKITVADADSLKVENLSNNGAEITFKNDIGSDEITVDNGELTSSEGAITGSTLTAIDGKVTAATDVDIAGDANIAASTVTATTGSVTLGALRASDSAITAGKDVNINGDANMSGTSSITAANDINLKQDLVVDSGAITITTSGGNIVASDMVVNGGSELRIKAENGVINAANLAATDISAQTLKASGDVAINSGAFALKGKEASSVAGSLTLIDSKASVADLTVGKNLDVSGGSLASSGTVTVNDNAAISNGAQVKLDTLAMASGKTLTVGNNDEAIGGTTLTVGSLSLNGADLLVDPAWGKASSNVAVRGFSSNGLARDMIVDGNVVVGRNSYLTLGSDNSGWLPGVVTGPMILPGLRQDGVTAALGIFSPITLGRGHSLTVDGAWRGGQSYNRNNSLINFANQSLLVVNGKGGNISYTGANKPAGIQAAISAQSPTSATVASGARLFVTGVEQDTSYVILDPQTIDVNFEDNNTAWAGDNIGSDNPLLILRRSDLSGGDRGEVTTRPMSASVALPGLDSELGSAMDNAQANGQIGVNEADMRNGERGQQFLSRALAQASPVYGNDPAGAALNVESAARMAVLGGVPQMALSANNAAGAAVTQRTSQANPATSGIQSMNSEGAIQDNGISSRGLALWLMPLYQSSNGFGMEAGNFDYDFSGALGGVAIGADYTFENMLRAGLLFNIGGGYMRGGGDLNATTNSMNFWGLGAYVGWNQNNFGLTADVNFTSTYNKVRQDIYGMGDFSELKLDVPAWALSAGLRAEYKVNTDYLDITPHVGFRYTNLNVASYDIKDHGTVIDGDSMTQNIWTFPIGVSFSRDVALANGWNFKPLLDLNVTPATGDIDAKSKVRFTGTGTEAELDTKMMDYVTYGGTAGIELKKDNFSVGVNYTGMFGAESSAHGVFGTFRYEF